MIDLKRTALAAVVILALACLGTGPASAQNAPEPEEEVSKAEAKQKAKEARIEEYLRKKEERRARREMEKQRKAEQEGAAAAPAGQAADRSRARRGGAGLSGDLRRVHEIIRNGPLGQDPTVREYLERIESGGATAQQIAAFGNFLGEVGMARAALAYYGLALQMENADSLLWLNVGTLHRQVGEYSQAASAYARSLSVDPNNAYAHYNLGAVMDEQGRYDEAVREYKMALTLDPSLGDPAVNPQAANNERLLAVQLMLYKEQEGSLGLPLLAVPGGDLDEEEGVEPSDE